MNRIVNQNRQGKRQQWSASLKPPYKSRIEIQLKSNPPRILSTITIEWHSVVRVTRVNHPLHCTLSNRACTVKRYWINNDLFFLSCLETFPLQSPSLVFLVMILIVSITYYDNGLLIASDSFCRHFKWGNCFRFVLFFFTSNRSSWLFREFARLMVWLFFYPLMGH